MKKNFFFLIFILVLSPHSASANPAPLKKLVRGFVNVSTFSLELPKQTLIEFNRGRKKTFHVSIWILCGIAKGTAYSLGRLGSGLWDILSFPFNHPKGYAPLMKPEFVFEKDVNPQGTGHSSQ